MATPQPGANPHMGDSGSKRDREKENGERPKFQLLGVCQRVDN